MSIDLKVHFWMMAKSDQQDVDLNYLATELELEDLVLRKRPEMPIHAILAGYGKDCLEYCISQQGIISTSEILNTLEERFKTKTSRINELREELDLDISVEIIVDENYSDRIIPELSRENLHFLSAIGASFCLYVYDWDVYQFDMPVKWEKKL